MVWLYLPPEAITCAQKKSGRCSASRSARARADSTSASTSRCQTIELFVTSSGKVSPHPRSWVGWKTRPWIARLSGTMLKPSEAKRGAAWWISYMGDIHANRSRLQAVNSATKTRAISGRTSPASSARSNRLSASLRTSVDIYDWGSNKSTMTFDAWVTALRQACLRRRKSARLTSVSDCSSWPTARVSSANGASRKEISAGNPKGRLEVSAAMWLTPRAQETSEKQDSFLKRNGDRTDRCFGSLTAQSALWPTATATDSLVQRARSPEKMIRKDGRNVLRTPSLAETVLQPEGFPYTKQDLEKAKSGGRYRIAKVQWPTPRAQEPGSTSVDHGLSLTEASKAWPTPQSTDYRERGNLSNPCIQRRMAMGKQVNLSMMAHPMAYQSGRQPLPTMTDGKESQPVLNPRFVEWLMGWPIGWTDSDFAATAWCRWSRLMRFALWQLKSSQKPEQNDLFSDA